MHIGALLKSIIYIMASSLLYPVLFLLVILTFWVLIYAGGFFAEWLNRLRLPKYAPEQLPRFMIQPDRWQDFPHQVQSHLSALRGLVAESGGTPSELEIENLLQERTLYLWRSLDRVKMIIRIGPSLGLIGTLIPMGTGLAALGQGDMTKLSSDLVIAFTTTVVGLSIGILAYFFYTLKRRWVEEDIKNIEMATELIINEYGSGSKRDEIL